jgi:putative addiction module CopG family antidote
MNITLRPEHEKLVAQAMHSGAYQDPDEVIARALELLHSEDEWLQAHNGEIAEKIERAFAQFEQGEFFSAEESRADMAKRKTAWLRLAARAHRHNLKARYSATNEHE